ncbi:MAG: M48 family metallopeptidase [Prevotellaceae bacterium]|nr:M48 family metallopeptidase [Prevotellaceae bacterium]
MPVKEILEDEALGRLMVRVNARARRLTFRVTADAIHVTVPPGTTLQEVRRAVERLRPRLQAAHEKHQRPPIDLKFHIDTPYFKLSLTTGTRDRFLSRSIPGGMEIVCPPGTDFHDQQLQAWLQKVIEEALRRYAKELLPPRLQALSRQHHLPYKSVRTNSSRGRWGSCSAQGNINLSYYLLLLPPHLVDYVLLHELCHTREMNHGAAFHALLDEHTGGKADALRKELKGYKTTFR